MIDGKVSYQGRLKDLIYERLGEGTLEIIINKESEYRFIMSMFEGNCDCKMRIRPDDGRLLLFGKSTISHVLQSSSIKNISFTWRNLTPKDLLLSIEGHNFCDDCVSSV
ncbi:hypothetical protein [Photobacterium leiognathi]|nr:hypothetical protein [Photobacterium leiognathi]